MTTHLEATSGDGEMSLGDFFEILSRIEKTVSEIEWRTEQIHQMAASGRKAISKRVKAKHIEFVWSMRRGGCPVCYTRQVIDQHGVPIKGEHQFDHFDSRSQTGLEETWLICVECHKKKTKSKDWAHAYFRAYQHALSCYIEKRDPMLPLRDSG